ncbi:MAG: Hsp70 family protein [Rhodococcus sp.]|nr:Hsp70 family protein [Rhodococcus sp. (in: high G+C Gram-positive bacteria)]
MSISLGIATGSAGVGSALLTRHTNGAQDIEYRYMSADQAHTDTGDLVRSSIGLMTTQVPTNPTTPDAIAVTYRTDEQHLVIKNALARSRRRVHLVPETEATLAYLRHTGEVAQYATVAIVDVGASGTGVSVIDQIDGTVLHSTRSSAVSGDVVDGLVYDHALAALRPSARRLVDEGDLRARCRGAKEQLSADSTSFVDADHAGGGSVEITSSTFDEIIAPVMRDLARVVRTSVSNAPRKPEAIALVGGGARIHGVARTMVDSIDAHIIAVAEPDTATAKGAALLASTGAVTAYPAVGAAEAVRTSPAAKATGALIGALIVGGLVFGYSVNALTPAEDPSVAPASTESAQTTAKSTSSTTEATGTSSDDDVTPAPAESNIIVTTTVIPDLPYSWTADPLPTTQDFTTTTPSTTPPSSSTTPESTPPTTTTPSTTESSPSLPGWPEFEWPDIPTFWPEPPENSPSLPDRNGNGSSGARSQTLDPTSKEPGPRVQQQNSIPTTSLPPETDTPPPPG